MNNRQPPRWVRILIRTLIGAAILTLIGNVAFVVADESGASMGQTIPALSWVQLADAKGINLWNYELAINFKSDIFDPGASVSAMLTEFLWKGYLGLTALAIWFVDWVLSFDWLTVIIAPLTAVGDAIRNIITQFGLAPAFLMVAGLVGAVFILRGKIARGVYEMLMSCFIVALSVTAFANPLELVAGPDGWIYQARDHTLELVAAMGDQAQSDQNAITSELITTFVRQPAQLVSFGQILDGGDCEEAYDTAVSAGPYGYESDIRDAVSDCNKAASSYADTPNGGMVTSALIQAPAGIMVLVMAILIGGTVMLALVATVLAALKTIINLVLAVLPGGARRPLAHSFAEVFIGIAVFIFAMFFLAVYLMVIQAVFRAHEGQPSKAFVIMLIVMILGLIAFVRYRKSLKAATTRLTDWMSKPPGGPAPRPLAPPGQGSHLMKAAGLYGAGRVLSSPQGRAALKNTAVVGAAALTGNPALAGRVLLNSATAKRAKNLAGRAIGPKPAASPAAAGGGGTSRTVFSGEAARPQQSSAAPPATSRPRHRSNTDDDTVVLHGTVVEPDEYPRLPMRRTRVLAAPPARPHRLRPSEPRPQLPPPPEPGTPPTQPKPSRPSPNSGPPRTTRRPQNEPPPRSTPQRGRLAPTRPGSRPGRRTR